MLPKPERVEVGQWWMVPPGCPLRIGDEDARKSWAWVVAASGTRYLGDGDAPAPSEWLIATLARHAFETNGGSRKDDIWAANASAYTRLAVTALALPDDAPADYAQCAVISLARILRGLGYY
jgi:hypothetical protein